MTQTIDAKSTDYKLQIAKHEEVNPSPFIGQRLGEVKCLGGFEVFFSW